MGRSDNVGLPFWRLYIVRFIAKMTESGPVLHQNSHFLVSNLAHILHIGERIQSCANLVHILRIGERILRIDKRKS